MSFKLILVRVVYRLKGLFKNPVDLFQTLGIEPDDEILEVGCAIGYHTFTLARLACNGKVYAVDISEEYLAYLKSKIQSEDNIQLIHSNAEAVEFPLASLDKVICFDTLHDIPDPEQAVQRWADFLRKNGKFCFCDPEIRPKQIEIFSEGKLRQMDTVQGIYVFTRR
ncbi:MAG: class I SAM-dependent methyltransferase [candidate division Zixibacteria bacterium]|nr:class I SAM-dependent methyltransferase [candidate division Zixibacteria bacterium]